MRAAKRGLLAHSLYGAAIAFIAAAPSAMAAGGNGSGGMSAFVPFRGYPAFRYTPFAPSPNSAFPRGFCCVTAAPSPPIVIQTVETPPVPERKPIEPERAKIATEQGVTVMRGDIVHTPGH